MATADKTWSWAAGAESWAFTPYSDVTGAYDGAYGNAAGSLYCMEGPAKNIPGNTTYWEIADTWANLFGIPAGATVTDIVFNSGDRRCTIYTGIINDCTIGPIELYDDTPTLQATLKASYTYTGVSSAWDAWGAGSSQSVPSAIQSASTTIRLRVSFGSNTGNDKTSNAKVYIDNLYFTITYTVGATQQSISGTLNASGLLGKKTKKTMNGTMNFSGLPIRRTATVKVGALTLAGELSTMKFVQRLLEGMVSFAGSLGRTSSFFRSITGEVSFSGGVDRASSFFRSVVGEVSFIGDVARKSSFYRVLTGEVSFTGAVKSGMMFLRSMAGELTFSGDLSMVSIFRRSLAGAVSFSGVISRSVGKALAGALTLAGVLSKKLWFDVAGVLSFVGDLSQSLVGGLEQLCAGIMSFSGDLQKKIFRQESGVLRFSGAISWAGEAVSAIIDFITFRRRRR